eukprot:TRINITY_DN15492_c0_g1_i1.p1 TRINITY_DN15492_c0_g1~~TRINITY_DN15492_c0_g1_i1.p1  ORF type:complete len:166 (+),score=24.60 TRINITY_DN15492_c0_g1_i1:49-546(+)
MVDKSFVNSLSFSSFYHQSEFNKIVHIVTHFMILFGLGHLMSHFIPALGHLAHVLLYIPHTVFFTRDVRVGVITTILFALNYALSAVIGHSSNGVYFAAGCFAALPIFQMLVHLNFEKFQPPFSVLETVYYTPFYLLLQVLTPASYRKDFKKEIVDLSKQWPKKE